MFDKLYQSFPVFASLAQIFNQLVAKIALAPPRRRNGIGISLNLSVCQLAEFFFKRAKIQPTAAQTTGKIYAVRETESFWPVSPPATVWALRR